MRIFFALFFATVYTVVAQTPQVPHKMQFAGMTLTIRDDARREIQKDVDALTQSPKHHAIKVERARTYFPIIEKVFEEEGLPDDFKYLVLQESALIPDAVSSSNAVGFWQFKDFTAAEMGLRVDRVVDERMNIVSSSRAAARYLKKNNFYFNNWVYALQAYQMGAGGVMKSVRETEGGLKHMEISSSTYWYVKKFLAHKIAFESAVSGRGQVQIVSYETHRNKQLSDIAKEVDVDEADLKLYNKWAKNGAIPDDKPYTVLIPVIGDAARVTIPAEAMVTAASSTPSVTPRHNTKGNATILAKANTDLIKINGINAIRAKSGESVSQLANRANADLSDFIKWNDITISDRILPQQYYLLGKKRARGMIAYHKVTADEKLWDISQEYGVQIKRLKKYNNLRGNDNLKPGMMLWLSAKKPKEEEVMVASEDVIQVDKAQSFSWTANPQQAEAGLASVVVDTPTEAASKIELQPTTGESNNTGTVAAAAAIEEVEVRQDSVESVPMPLESTPTEATSHVVVVGETLYAIAARYKVAVMDLVSWNNLKLQDGIKPGQVLKLSDDQLITRGDKATVKQTTIQHEVKSTDTLYSVARKYNVTIQELMEWNNKKDFNLSVGEKLRIQTK